MLKHIQKILFLGLLSFFLLSVCGSASAATRYVPSQYGSIQAAINASSNGDAIEVAPGIYREHLEIVGKYIELRSVGGRDNTIIAPNPGKTGIMIQQVPYRVGLPRLTIKEFRITGGNSPDGQGGAITIANNADPIIENNLIDNNYSTVHGGGVLVFNNSNPTIRGNNINNNSAYMFGGGIFAVKNSSPVIYNNTLNNNTASGAVFPNGGASGGAIYLENDTANPAARSKPIILKNNIYSNTAAFAGGAISLRTGVDAIIEENTFTGNQASYGGGVHIETEGSSPVIYNNTFQNNTASFNGTFSGSGYGGGISVYASSQAKIMKNQLLGNAASVGGGGIVLAESSNSIISGNQIAGNYVADPGSNTGGGLYIASATANVMNNIIRNNTAGIGGGIGILDNAVIAVTNNTIVKNETTYTGASSAGGGMFIRDNNGITATINNNIFALNEGHQIFEEREEATYTNNLIANDNSGLYFSYDAGGITNVNSFNGNSSINNPSGNVSGDPLFVNASSDNYELQSSSPAKDTGTATNASAEDYRKAMRPFNGTNDIGAYEYTTEMNFKSPVFRFWSSEYSSHFYANSTSERNTVVSTYPVQTWQYEFQAFDAFTTTVASSTPIYRFYSQLYNAHFYTADEGEKDYVVNNFPDEIWLLEGTAYHAYPLAYGGSSNTVWRFWSPTYQNHFFTANDAEKDFVDTNYPDNIWTFEGGRYKVPK